MTRQSLRTLAATTYLVVTLFVGDWTCAQAAEKSAKDFDIDGNGFIDPDEALAAHRYLLAKKPPEPADANMDGRVTDEERAAYERAFDEALSDRDEYRERVHRNPSVTNSVQTFDRFWFPDVHPPDIFDEWHAENHPLKNLLIRRTHEDLTLANAATEFKQAQPAIVNYARDVDSGGDAVEVRGAIMHPFKLFEDAEYREKTSLTGVHFMPSLTIDRVVNESDRKKEVNSWATRVGLELEFASVFPNHDPTKPVGPTLSNYLRANAAYASDFDLDSGVIAAEFQWEPVFAPIGIGILQNIPLPLLKDIAEYRLRTYMHVEYGDVLSKGEKANLIKDDTFLRMGPKIQLEIFPKSPVFNRLSFLLKYEYLEGLSGAPDSSKLFEAGVNFGLDRRGHLTLNVAYRNGDVPLTKEETETFTVGLGVKF